MLKKPMHLALIVSLITFFVYIPSLWNGFINWDDDRYVYENAVISSSITLDFIKKTLLSVYYYNYHPLTIFSYAIDYAVWELNPFGYHLTNIILHTLNTFLVFILVSRLMECGFLKNPPPSLKEDNTFSLIAASMTALLFGIHPIHVESVAWISERKDVLCAFFYLLSLLCYIDYASMESKNRKSYIVSLISFILALMSKPMAVSLPAVLLLLDFYPLKRLQYKEAPSKMVLLEKLPFFIFRTYP